VAVSFIGLKKQEYPGKSANQPKGTDKLYPMLYRVHLAMSRIRTTTLVAIGTDCIGSCQSNYQTTTTPLFLWNEVEPISVLWRSISRCNLQLHVLFF